MGIKTFFTSFKSVYLLFTDRPGVPEQTQYLSYT